MVWERHNRSSNSASRSSAASGAILGEVASLMAEAETPPAPEAPPAPKSPSSLVGVTIAGFVVIIGSCAAYHLWPRGERLGVIDLRDSPTLSVDVAAGDKLTFRLDTITVGTKSGYPDSSRSRTNQVRDELQASVITVTSVGSDGASKASTECGAFAGKSTTGSSDTDTVTSSGHPLDCSLDVPTAGAYTLTAKVAWVPKDVREAFLDVRRQKGK